MYVCAKHFAFSIGAWYKAHRKGWIAIRPFESRRYDWHSIQIYYDEGHSYRECREHFGFCATAWTKATQRGALKKRKRQRPLDEILRLSTSRGTLKRRLLDAGLLIHRCQGCGLDSWQGQPLTVQIDHINGVNNDWELKNLRMLCPNCHSQTETFGGRNARRRRLQEAAGTCNISAECSGVV